jgi:hypothetical protein
MNHQIEYNTRHGRENLRRVKGTIRTQDMGNTYKSKVLGNIYLSTVDDEVIC